MAYDPNRKLTSSERSALPDTAFLLPKYRKLPFKQFEGRKLKISLSHVRNALARANQVQGVPKKEVRAAIRRARMILDSKGGYKSAPPRPISLAANTAGLTRAQTEDAADLLISQGLDPTDIEVLPLGRRQCVIFWTGLEWDEITSPEDLKDMAARKYKSNLGKKTSTKSRGITRTEAQKLWRDVVDDFEGARVVSMGGGKYGVEVDTGTDYPIRITSLRQLEMVANRGTSTRRTTTLAEARAIARELEGDFEGVQVVKSGRGHAVEFIDDAGWPVRVSHLDQLSMVPNFLFGSGKKAPADTSSMSKEEFVRHMFNDREWREAYLGMQSDFAMRDANAAFKRMTKDQIEATVASKLEDARRRRKIAQERAAAGMVPNKWRPKPPQKPRKGKLKTYEEIIHEAEKDKYPFDYAVRNGGDAKAEIIEGIVKGLWPETDGIEYNAEALEVAQEFYDKVKQMNRLSLATFYDKLPRKRGTPEDFGYYLGMEAQGHGVAYWDDYDGPDGVQLWLPNVEADDLGHDLFFSWDPKRLKFLAWAG
jgi:hypothetical protein